MSVSEHCRVKLFICPVKAVRFSLLHSTKSYTAFTFSKTLHILCGVFPLMLPFKRSHICLAALGVSWAG